MDDRGFTIIELVMVIIVVSILAAVAIPQFGRYWAGIKLNNAVMKIASDIRYAQNRATTTQQRTRVIFSSSTTYDIQSCPIAAPYNTTTCKCPDPADNLWVPATGFPINLNNTEFLGVTITAPAAGSWLEFDSLGKPSINPCGTATGTTITVQNGSSTKPINVATQTGMVSY
ncbi:MAG: prepilin-type N-terminal cleavage/methylation domain-containing protein [Deltaproteobacteria bacterium]|nr:prepilin-type N-terminal cleavage/methylation domain-containing protein [Deltaproteobacteria bacterium]